MSYGTYETLILERQGNVGWLINNRPDRLNAMNSQMRDEFADAIEFRDVKAANVQAGGDPGGSRGLVQALASPQIAHAGHHAKAGARQLDRRQQPDAAGGAGNQSNFFSHNFSVRRFVSRRRKIENARGRLEEEAGAGIRMERETGIEPVTSSLGSWRSTAELLPLTTVASEW